MILDFKLHYKVITIKTEWFWNKNRYEGQWKRIEDPHFYPHSFAHLSFDKGDKNICGEKTASSTNVAG
jgi:hypothetical protein